MKQINYKKLILPNIPYVFFVYLFDKVGQAVRLAPGADISAKIRKLYLHTIRQSTTKRELLLFCSLQEIYWNLLLQNRKYCLK